MGSELVKNPEIWTKKEFKIGRLFFNENIVFLPTLEHTIKVFLYFREGITETAGEEKKAFILKRHDKDITRSQGKSHEGTNGQQ